MGHDFRHMFVLKMQSIFIAASHFIVRTRGILECRDHRFAAASIAGDGIEHHRIVWRQDTGIDQGAQNRNRACRVAAGIGNTRRCRDPRRLIEEHGVKGFKFHPTVQGFLPYDRMAWPLYEVIAEYKLPAIFHSGHSGIGSGMRCGGGLRLQNSNPMLLEDVAIDFPDIDIVIAHPSWPWQDEALSLAVHKPNIWIDLSGWSPKYFPPQLVQYANTQLKDRILFGSDYPLITPDRWMKDFEDAGFKPEVMPGILKDNAVRLLGFGEPSNT